MEHIPALSVLTASLIVFTIVVLRFSTDQLLKLLTEANIVLFSSFSLFGIVLIVHLFKEQAWTSDILKVLAGALVGGSAASVVKGASSQTAIGTNIKQAMRDIVEQMYGDIHDVKDSVLNIQQHLTKDFGAQTSVWIHYVHRMRVEADDERIVQFLRRSTESSGNKAEWNELCLRIPEFLSAIAERCDELRSAGWEILSVSPNDNLAKGILVNISARRRLTEETHDAVATGRRTPRGKF